MTEEQLRKAATLWRVWNFDTMKMAEFIGVPESVIWNNMTAIIRKCPAKKRAVAC